MFIKQSLTFSPVEPWHLAKLRLERNRNLSGVRTPIPVQTMEQQEKWYHSLDERNLAFVVSEGEDDIGFIAIKLEPENQAAALVGCTVFEGFEGKGYGTRILRGAAEWLIRDLGYHRVQAEALELHTRAQRIILKAGFKKEGTKRGYIWRDGCWQDFEQYSILAGEL